MRLARFFALGSGNPLPFAGKSRFWPAKLPPPPARPLNPALSARFFDILMLRNLKMDAMDGSEQHHSFSGLLFLNINTFKERFFFYRCFFWSFFGYIPLDGCLLFFTVQTVHFSGR